MKISDFQSGSFRTIVASKTYEGSIHLLRSHFGVHQIDSVWKQRWREVMFMQTFVYSFALRKQAV